MGIYLSCCGYSLISVAVAVLKGNLRAVQDRDNPLLNWFSETAVGADDANKLRTFFVVEM